MAANLNDFKTSKKIAFSPNRIFLTQKFIGCYIESDKKMKKYDDMGTSDPIGKDGLPAVYHHGKRGI